MAKNVDSETEEDRRQKLFDLGKKILSSAGGLLANAEPSITTSMSDEEKLPFNNFRNKAPEYVNIVTALLDEIQDDEIASDLSVYFSVLFMIPVLSLYTLPQTGDIMKLMARQMREARLNKRLPYIKKRRELLKNTDFDLEQIGRSRKFADSLETEFAKLCEAIGVAPVSGKQLQRDARDILKERHESSGQSLRAPND